MPPKSRIARRRASRSESPASMLRRVSISRWKRSSSFISRSCRRRPTSAPNDVSSSWYQAMSSPLKGKAKHAVHGTRGPLPVGDLGLELLLSFARDEVVARAAVVLARAPLGTNPSPAQHALECGIEGPLIHVEDLARDLPQAQREPPAVHRLGGEQLERQHLESPLKDLGALVRLASGCHGSPLDGQKEERVSTRSSQGAGGSLF